MNSTRRGVLCAALLWPVLALAQAAAADPPATEVRGGEPNVKRSVIEDDGSRIEELRVRGQARSVTVKTKGPLASSYEINVGDPSREMDATADDRRGAVGHSMWRVFSF